MPPMSSAGQRITPLPRDEWDDRLLRLLAASPGGTDEPELSAAAQVEQIAG